jgi:hypothetical protein
MTSTVRLVNEDITLCTRPPILEYVRRSFMAACHEVDHVNADRSR